MPDGAGRLHVTLTADPAAHASLVALRLGAATNALVDVGEQTGLSGNTTILLPPGTLQAQLVIRRATAGQATTVALVVVDACGEWPTVLGGGPSAF